MFQKIFVRMKWYLYSLFVVLLALKIQITSAQRVPWVIAFVPLFVCGFCSISQKICECKGYLASDTIGSSVIALRQIAVTIDYIGSFLGSIGLCILLQTLDTTNIENMKNTVGSLLPICLLPLWITILVSTALRLFTLMVMGEVMKKSLYLRSSLRPSGYHFSIINMVVQLILRGVVPMLLTFRLCGIITDWSAVFSPLWVLIFMGIPLGILPIARAPMAHNNGSNGLQRHAIRLIYIVAAHIITLVLASLVSLVWLTQSVGEGSSINKNSFFGHTAAFPAVFVMSPLMFALLVFAALQAKLLDCLKTYEVGDLHVLSLSLCLSHIHTHAHTHELVLSALPALDPLMLWSLTDAPLIQFHD